MSSNFFKMRRVGSQLRRRLLALFGALLITVAIVVVASASAGTHTGDSGVVTVQYYAGGNADSKLNSLDLYLPDADESVKGNVKGNLPVVIFIHGGAWHIGDKSNDGPSNVARTLADNGVICANINYRLSPSVKHPIHVKDAARAIKWVYENIGSYGGDPNKLFVSGHSAGAHLAALVTLDTKYLEAESVPFSNIRGAIPISGPFDLTRENANFKKFCKLDGAFGSDAGVLNDASPLSHIRSDAPPFLCFAAQFDSEPVRDDAEKLVAELKTAGVDAKAMIVKWRNHMTILRKFGTRRDIALDEMLEFVKRNSR